MSNHFTLMVAALASLFCFRGLADDGQVPVPVLRSLGLEQIQPVSDKEGMQVRGKISTSQVVSSGRASLRISLINYSFAASTAIGDSAVNPADNGATSVNVGFLTGASGVINLGNIVIISVSGVVQTGAQAAGH